MAAARWKLRGEIMLLPIAVTFSAVLLFAVNRGLAAEPRQPEVIELLVRADDMAVAQSVNEACIASYKDGIARSVEVIANGAWFPDAIRLLKENPGLDVG